MGRVCPTYVKRAARQLLERYPDKFSTDFEHNRKMLTEIAIIESQSLKNKIAGYLTTLMKQKAEEA
jgi:small subunit ribosomal protein S17e